MLYPDFAEVLIAPINPCSYAKLSKYSYVMKGSSYYPPSSIDWTRSYLFTTRIIGIGFPLVINTLVSTYSFQFAVSSKEDAFVMSATTKAPAASLQNNLFIPPILLS